MEELKQSDFEYTCALYLSVILSVINFTPSCIDVDGFGTRNTLSRVY